MVATAVIAAADGAPAEAAAATAASRTACCRRRTSSRSSCGTARCRACHARNALSKNVSAAALAAARRCVATRAAPGSVSDTSGRWLSAVLAPVRTTATGTHPRRAAASASVRTAGVRASAVKLWAADSRHSPAAVRQSPCPHTNSRACAGSAWASAPEMAEGNKSCMRSGEGTCASAGSTHR